MPAVGVLLLAFAIWFVYAGTHGIRPIATGRLILTRPADAGTIIAGALSAAQAVHLDYATSKQTGNTIGGNMDGNSQVKPLQLGVNPYSGFAVTTPYGQAGHAGSFGAAHVHQGIDYGMPSGTELYSLISGTVHTTTGGLGGNIIRVDGSGPFSGWQVYFDHVRQFNRKSGDKVALGQYVAQSGGGANDPGKGDATGPHLHLEVHHNGSVVDPASFFTWESANQANIVGALQKGA